MRRLRTLALAAGLSVCAVPGVASGFVWPNVPERVEKALSSSDAAERRRAAGLLSELPREVALPLVERALADPDVEVRIRAARAAAVHRFERGGDRVIKWLGDSDSRLRLAAAEVILVSPTPESVTALGRVLADPDMQVRLAAASAMGQSELPEAVSPLLGHLDDSAPEVRAEVARALGRLGDERAVVPLVGKVQDTASMVRRAVVRALGELRDQRAVSALMLAISDASDDVRVEALTALGKIGAPEAALAIAPLTSQQGDANAPTIATRVRVAAVRALGGIDGEAALLALLDALGDSEAFVRDAAVNALAQRGPAAGERLVTELGAAQGPAVAEGIARALGRMRPEGALSAVARATQRGSLPLRSGLQALAELGDGAALPTVLEHIEHPDPGVRNAAVQAATKLLDPREPDGRAVDPAIVALQDTNVSLEERARLVALLGRTGSPRAIPILLDLAESPSATLRAAVFAAFGELRAPSPEVDRALMEGLEDESAAARREAALALSTSATPGAAAELIERLLQAPEQDRGAVGLAVSGALGRASDDALVQTILERFAEAPEGAREAMIEGLGRMATPAAGKGLEELATGIIADRRKVAEALAGHPGQLALLGKLAQDPDPSVRANAVWSLGTLGEPAAIERLAGAMADVDVAVAGNAAAGLGRVGVLASAEDRVAAPLCAALDDSRAYVRANAIASLSLIDRPCEDRDIARLLFRDDSEAVRKSVASYLHAKSDQGEEGVEAKRLLSRCLADERNAEVADRCREPVRASDGFRELTVFVVPDDTERPVGATPFALVLPSGLMRLGVTDRRGAVFESAASRGQVQLAVPAPLAL